VTDHEGNQSHASRESQESREKHRRLVHVRYAVAAVGEAEHSLRDAVTRARSVGASWSEVAEAVGAPPEEVRDRFSGADHPGEGDPGAQSR
jgi:hypothetical protein